MVARTILSSRNFVLSGLAAAIVACPLAAATDVLVLGDGGSEPQVIAALQAAGHAVTDAGPYEFWDGSGLEGMDAVVFLDGVNYGDGLTPQADAALAAFVAGGGRLVMTEWTAFDVAYDLLGGEIAQLMAVTYAGAFDDGNTWTVALPFHPLAAGVPSMWSDAAWFSVVVADPASTVVITGTNGNPLLAYRTDSGGAVIHLNHGMAFAMGEIHPNALQLLVNAVGAELAGDCDGDGLDDAMEIAAGAPDANGNGIPDRCEVSGAITGSVVWESGHTVYVTADLTIEGTLSIEPGVEVVPAAGVEMLVAPGGELLVGGTAADSVRMCPVGLGRWDGIHFEGGSGELRHAELSRLNTWGILIESASPLIDACVIRDVAPLVGDAFGVDVVGSSHPVISNCIIHGITGADAPGPATSGSNGPNAPNAADGGGAQACLGGGHNGANATSGGGGEFAGYASGGGYAVGVLVGPGSAATVASCRISDLKGGDGADGGSGGHGGAGGDGGDGLGGAFCGGNGGNGGDGGFGPFGTNGAYGGDAAGVWLTDPEPSVVIQNVIWSVSGGNGGKGGNGGNGGPGGDGGNGAENIFSGGDGGHGGDGGPGGDAGDGGSAGSAYGIGTLWHATNIGIAQNTIAGTLSRGLPGAPGTPGQGGPGGSAGSGAAAGGTNGSTGSFGPSGAIGATGLIGRAAGIHVEGGPGPVVTASNNIIAPGNPAYSIGMNAYGETAIAGDFNCFFDSAFMAVGNVAAGSNSIVADPVFLDADGADDLPGTEDDDLRLAAGSPCVDAGGAAEIPDDAADLDGDLDTQEQLPLDAAGNPRIIAAAVDIGAYESGTASPPCRWDLDGSGDVGVTDFLALLQNWGSPWGITDFLALLQQWGPCP